MYIPMYIAIKDKSVEIVHSMDASGRQSYTIDAPWRNLRVRFCVAVVVKCAGSVYLMQLQLVPNYSR